MGLGVPSVDVDPSDPSPANSRRAASGNFSDERHGKRSFVSHALHNTVNRGRCSPLDREAIAGYTKTEGAPVHRSSFSSVSAIYEHLLVPCGTLIGVESYSYTWAARYQGPETSAGSARRGRASLVLGHSPRSKSNSLAVTCARHGKRFGPAR